MTPLFNRQRATIFMGLMALAIVQLGAVIVVASVLHGSLPHAVMTAAVAALVGFAAEVGVRRLAEGLSVHYAASLRMALFRHLMAVDPRIIDRQRHGAMLQSFVGDLTALRQWVAEGVMRGLVAMVTLALLLSWLTYFNPVTGLMAVGIVTMAVVAAVVIMPGFHQSITQVRQARGRVSAFASERLARSATVLVSGRIATESKRLRNRVKRLNEAALGRAWRTGILRALPHLATSMIVIGTVYLAPDQAGGEVAGFVLVSMLMGVALRDLARSAELAVPGLVAKRRMVRMLALPRLRYSVSRDEVVGSGGQLVLNQLVVSEGATPISAKVQSGDVLLLSGDHDMRLALLRIIGGLQRPISGGLSWDGIDLGSLRPQRRRQLVGIVMGELGVISGSNRYNIRYRAPDASAAEIADIARIWSIDPDGQHASPLHLSLARAMLGRPAVLLLSLDTDALGHGDMETLARTLEAWPGLVIISSSAPRLRHLANRHWRLETAGLDDLSGPRVATIASEGKAA